MAPERSPSPAPGGASNDAFLVQLVRGALGRDGRTRVLPRPNVSSCKFIITLHGRALGPGERRAVEEVVRSVPGVRGVVNKIGDGPAHRPRG